MNKLIDIMNDYGHLIQGEYLSAHDKSGKEHNETDAEHDPHLSVSELFGPLVDNSGNQCVD